MYMNYYAIEYPSILLGPDQIGTFLMFRLFGTIVFRGMPPLPVV